MATTPKDFLIQGLNGKSSGQNESSENTRAKAEEPDRKKDSWFSGLKVWPKGKGDEDGQNFDDSSGNSEGRKDLDIRNQAVARDTMSPDEEEADLTSSPETGASRGAFQWPWGKDSLKDSANEKDFKNTEARGEELGSRRKKATHTDSKPGASLRATKNSATSQTKNSRGKPPWEETWNKVLQAITTKLPNTSNSKRAEPDQSAASSERDIASSNASNGIHSETSDSEPTIPQGSSSIRELYSPPSDAADSSADRPPQQRRTPKWPKMPWAHEDTQEKDDARVSGGKSEIKRSSSPRISTIQSISKSEEQRDDSTRPQVTSGFKDEVERDSTYASENATDSPSSKKDGDESQVSKTKGDGNNIKKPSLQLPPVRTQLKVGHIDVASIPQRDVAAIRLIFGSETFFATETLSPPGGLIFRGNLRGEPKATIAKLEDRLASRLGDKYTLCLAEGEEDLRPVVVIVPTARDKRPATPRQRFFAIVIAFMTISTCLARGIYAAAFKPMIQPYYPVTSGSIFEKFFSIPSAISLTTAASVGIIIAVSQVIQRLVASRYRTRVALPYFIPSFQLGSFGAIVQLASPTPTRAALFDIAFAGAATLVIASLALLLVGLRLSTTFPGVVPIPMSTVSSSLVMGFLTQKVPHGQILVDYGRSLIALHPLAVIGANCLTIAALNLLPMRQLDGGRIISALYGRRTAVFASRVTVLFLLLASTKSPYFVVFLAAVTFGPWSVDRPSKNELTEPDGVRTIVGYLFMLLMIGILLPYPACKFFGTL